MRGLWLARCHGHALLIEFLDRMVGSFPPPWILSDFLSGLRLCAYSSFFFPSTSIGDSNSSSLLFISFANSLLCFLWIIFLLLHFSSFLPYIDTKKKPAFFTHLHFEYSTWAAKVHQKTTSSPQQIMKFTFNNQKPIFTSLWHIENNSNCYLDYLFLNSSIFPSSKESVYLPSFCIILHPFSFFHSIFSFRFICT
jgi:hypothetical protein